MFFTAVVIVNCDKYLVISSKMVVSFTSLWFRNVIQANYVFQDVLLDLDPDNSNHTVISISLNIT